VQRVVTDEKLEGDVFRMKVQYEAGVRRRGEDRRRRVRGHWQGGGHSGTLKAKRRP